MSLDAAADPDDTIHIVVDGRRIPASRGQTVAAALLNADDRIIRHARGRGDARGLYCAMGVCYECIVRVDGVIERACMRIVRDDMRIERLQRFERKAGT